MMADLSPEARRLEFILSHLGSDHLLSFLANLAAGSNPILGLPLTLIVDGILMNGTLAKGDQFAEHADQALGNIVRSVPLTGLEASTDADTLRRDLAAVFQERGALRSLAEAHAEKRRGARQRIETYLTERDENFAFQLDALPSGLVEDAATEFVPPSVLSLTNASMLITNQGWTTIGYMRVLTAHVAAWWIREVPSQTG